MVGRVREPLILGNIFTYGDDSLLEEREGYGGDKVSGNDNCDLGDLLPPLCRLDVLLELIFGLSNLGLGFPSQGGSEPLTARHGGNIVSSKLKFTSSGQKLREILSRHKSSYSLLASVRDVS